jgi:hypothetical protein
MDSKKDVHNNLHIYFLLFIIENSMRELIIELLDSVDGPRWYKSRLPGDVLKKYRDGLAYEKKIKWTHLIPHHPIYYIDFSDLAKIISREDNWKEAFKNVFGTRTDIFVSMLAELEPIRNKIAHNRKTLLEDVNIVKGVYDKLSAFIGEKRVNELASRCTSVQNIKEQLIDLQQEAERAFHICKSIDVLSELKVWKVICKEWWFDETYLSHNLDDINNFFKTIEEYRNLPRSRGTGFKIEIWIKSIDIETKFKKAQNAFYAILDGKEQKDGFDKTPLSI